MVLCSKPRAPRPVASLSRDLSQRLASSIAFSATLRHCSRNLGNLQKLSSPNRHPSSLEHRCSVAPAGPASPSELWPPDTVLRSKPTLDVSEILGERALCMLHPRAFLVVALNQPIPSFASHATGFGPKVRPVIHSLSHWPKPLCRGSRRKAMLSYNIPWKFGNEVFQILLSSSSRMLRLYHQFRIREDYELFAALFHMQLARRNCKEPIEWRSLHVVAERGVNWRAHAGPADENIAGTHGPRLYVCHQIRVPNPQRSSLRSLAFARFARSFKMD